jgi:prevent-host-death family protein
MKTMTVFEARNHFARTLEAAKEEIIIVTRNGRPVAAIQGIDDDDIEDLLLERSERFWAMIARARRGKPIAIEALRKRVTGPRPSGGRAARSRPRRKKRAGTRAVRA